MTLEITGVIVDHEDPSRSLANVNGKSVRAGAAVDGKGLVKVHRVERSVVWFLYKGEVIRHAVGRVRSKGKRGGRAASHRR